MHVRLLLLSGLLGFFTACTPAEEYIYCETALDCPEGWECGPEYVCIETGTTDTAGGADNSLPEQDTVQVDDGVMPVDEGAATDDTAIAEEDTALADDETMTEADTAETDDEPAVEEDAIVTDDTPVIDEDTLIVDEDTVVVDDQPLVDDDVQLVDEDMAIADEDTAVVDEDIPVIDDDIMVADQDIVEKTKIIGTDNYTQQSPWSPNNDFRYSATIYPKAQVSTSAITITRLAWESSSAGTSTTIADIKIYLKETTATTIPSATTFTGIVADATEVFSGTLTGTQGWNEKILDIPYAYSGTKNLMILTSLTCTNGAQRWWRYSGTSSNTSHGWYSNTDPAGENGINLEGYPNLKVTYY